VFLPVRATTADENAVEAALRATPDVVSVRKIARAEAKKVFECLFAHEPDLTRSVDAASLPVSFRVEVREGTNLDRLVRALESVPGVDEVVTYD
jgi:cell division protein FtsX